MINCSINIYITYTLYQSIIPSTDVTQLTLTLKMTTAQVVETSVTVNNNSNIQDYFTRTIILILVMEFFLIYFTITRIKKIVRYTEDFVM